MAQRPVTAQQTQLETSAARALFEGQADAWILGLASTERPPRGLAGTLDWHLRGWISQSLRQGIFEGLAGECAYVPHVHQGRTLHLLLVGLGDSHGKRKRALPPASLTALKQNLKALGRASWGISVADLGEDSVEPLSHCIGEAFKGGQLWISP